MERSRTRDWRPQPPRARGKQPSLAQGAHRLARGRNFFATCEEVSGSLGLPLHFTLAEVEGAGHSTLKMVYGLPNVQNPEDTGHRGENSAFNLLFE